MNGELSATDLSLLCFVSAVVGGLVAVGLVELLFFLRR